MEPGVCFRSDDGTLPLDSHLAKWEEGHNRISELTKRPVNVLTTMKESIIFAGFINVQEHDYKIPVGGWPKHKVYKDAGRLNLEQLDTGLEGYLMFTYTHFGDPEPWAPEQVHVLIADVKEELKNKKYHAYTIAKRVWAQKPFDEARS